MANTKVEFKINTTAKEVYIVGNVAQLGAWDAKKAVKADFCAECGKFHVAKMLPAGETVEFKVLSAKCWCAVEKGANGEELANHSFVASKGLTVEVEVAKFAE